MSRHPQNPNLTLYSGSHYEGYPVYQERGPLIEEYLRKLYRTMDEAIDDYGRVFAFRIDLHFPVKLVLAEHKYTNQTISNFLDSFNAKIEHAQQVSRKKGTRVHGTTVRYVWVREVGPQAGRPHYHLVILLNYDAFNTLGKYESGRDNLFNRLERAWASALGLPVESAKGLFHIPQNPRYLLQKGDVDALSDFFYRASYFCKAADKHYGDGQRVVGCSRIKNK